MYAHRLLISLSSMRRSGVFAVLLWAASSRFPRARATVISVDWNLDAATPSTSIVDVGDEVVFAWDDGEDDELGAVGRSVYFHPSSSFDGGGPRCSETNRRPVGRASGASYVFDASEVGNGTFADAPCGSGRVWNVTVVLSVPPGSNDLCDDGRGRPRARRDWDRLTAAERELFLEAVETVVDRGLYQAFVGLHVDHATSVYAHRTCAFALWHRRFALAMENLLRSADPRFACLALPYWNVMEHHLDQRRNLCWSLGSCSRVVTDVGGVDVRAGVERVHGGHAATGALIDGRPVSGVRDDNGRVGVVRDERILEDPIPAEASYELWRATLSIPSFTSFAQRLQTTVHDEIHNGVGGTLSTMGSPADPLFWIWHSTIDLFLWAWETCHLDPPVATASSPETATPWWAFPDDAGGCARDDEARELFPRVRATDELYVKRGDEDARDHPDVGAYFKDALSFADVAVVRDLGRNEFTYEGLTPIMWDALLDPAICPSAGDVRAPPSATRTAAWAADLDDVRDATRREPTKEDLPNLRPYLKCLECRETRNATAPPPPESDLAEPPPNNTVDCACGFSSPNNHGATTEETNETDAPSTSPSAEGTLAAATNPNVTVTVHVTNDDDDDDAAFSADDPSSRSSWYASLSFVVGLVAAILSSTTISLLLLAVPQRRGYAAVPTTNRSLVVARIPS